MNTVEAHVYGEPPSIGRPTPNNSVYILDPDTMHPVKAGEQGIMWAGGNGITRGYVLMFLIQFIYCSTSPTSYIGLPELTQKKYKPDPWRPGG